MSFLRPFKDFSAASKLVFSSETSPFAYASVALRVSSGILLRVDELLLAIPELVDLGWKRCPRCWYAASLLDWRGLSGAWSRPAASGRCALGRGRGRGAQPTAQAWRDERLRDGNREPALPRTIGGPRFAAGYEELEGGRCGVGEQARDSRAMAGGACSVFSFARGGPNGRGPRRFKRDRLNRHEQRRAGTVNRSRRRGNQRRGDLQPEPGGDGNAGRNALCALRPSQLAEGRYRRPSGRIVLDRLYLVSRCRLRRRRRLRPFPAALVLLFRGPEVGSGDGREISTLPPRSVSSLS